jgi:Tfp pilus assembly protein PilF
MKSMIRVFGLGLGLLVAACAQEPPPGGEFDALAARPASSLAVQIERAERTLDRGTDARQARASLEAALQDPGIAPEERRQALLALSRALEAVGDREQAIAVVEQEIAARGNDSTRGCASS